MNRNAKAFALLLTLISSLPLPARQSEYPGKDEAAAWSQLEESMQKMHSEMASIKPSGDNDLDFVNLMLPHHQAALDMAQAELAAGSDPQMRRLAQEIVTDQQSEIQLMKLWLKQHTSARTKPELLTSPAKKGN